jgi:hypothetical protein
MVQQILSEEFRRMQKLAGIITEGDENFITLAINYNTDQDDLDYIAGILKKAGITSTVTTDKEVKIKINKADKDKLAKVLRKNGFELIDPTQIRSSYLDLEEDLTGNAKSLSTKKQLGKAQSNQLNEFNINSLKQKAINLIKQEIGGYGEEDDNVTYEFELDEIDPEIVSYLRDNERLNVNYKGQGGALTLVDGKVVIEFF